MVSVVVEINGSCGVLEEVSALHADLGVCLNAVLVIYVVCAFLFHQIDAVILIWFILLHKNYLLQTHRLCF